MIAFEDGTHGDFNDAYYGVTAKKITLQSVNFSGNQTVVRDQGGDYTGPQWLDTDMNGQINDPGVTTPYSNGTIDGATEYVYPVSYMRSSTGHDSRLTATVSLPYSATAGSGWLIKGSAAGYTFPAQSVSASGGALTATLTAQEAVPQAIRDTEVDITWQLSTDGGASFFTVGENSNRVYVTGGNANGAHETVLDIGCGSADGVNMREDYLASDQRTAVDHIWGKFSGLNVKRVDGTLMQYNHDADTGMHAPGMLAHPSGKGQCTAWADLLVKTLGAQGISANPLDIASNQRLSDSGFTVRAMPAQGSQGADYVVATTHGTTQGGFVFHEIVNVGVYPDRLFDPSYGGVAYAGGGLSRLAVYENQNVIDVWQTGSSQWIQQSHADEDLLLGSPGCFIWT